MGASEWLLVSFEAEPKETLEAPKGTVSYHIGQAEKADLYDVTTLSM